MKKTTDLCRGCYDDFYNPGCWSYEGAEVVEKCFIHLSLIPPWRVDPETTLSCHRRQRYVAVSPDHPQITSDPDHVQKHDGGNYQ